MNTLDSNPSPCLKGIFPRCYHLKQKLTIAMGLAAAALLLPANASAQCVTATAGGVWTNTTMTAQTSTFTATFDATPSASPTNSVVALSNGVQTAYANFSCLARFNPTGDIDARNGGAFAAASTIPYKAGVAYHFRLVVNVAAQTYSIYVTPAGGSELTVGLNYAFRIAATSLNWWGVSVATAGTGGVGTVTVCNFSTGGTLSQAGTPSFSPAPGTYTSAQSVAITTATSGASIRYTTDGSTPGETAGTLYSGPVNISATATLKAIAYESGFTDSAITSGTYTITSQLPTGIEINSGGPAVSPFLADEDFTGGGTIDHANTINTSKVTNPAPAAVYQSARVAATAGAGTTFSYTIGGFTAGSSNTVRLHFCETFHTTAGSRVFNVSINGMQVLTNFDIFATAGGQNIANIQQFTEAANSSGQYVIVFTSVTDKALISGIEVQSNQNGSVPTATFSANPTAISQGGSSTLSWSTTNATSVSINNGIGTVAASGSLAVQPAATTTYTLTATGPGGTATASTTVTVSSSTVSHYEYVLPDQNLYVYDMGNNFQLLKHISIPQVQGVRGIGAVVGTHMLYISYGQYGNHNVSVPGSLLKYDLLTDTVVWARSYTFGVDSFDISPDGSTLYMPDGENSGDGTWYVIDAATGNVTGSINSGYFGPHDTVVSLDGAYVFLCPHHSPELVEASTSTNSAVLHVPLQLPEGPFTINGKHTLAFSTETGLFGFQVLDTTSGAVLFTVPIPGFSVPPGFTGSTPDHGISLSPDEKEIYLIDAANGYAHVFDVSGLPSIKPSLIANVRLTTSFTGTQSPCLYDCNREGWIRHTLDGNYVLVGDSGNVISTSTRQVVATLPELYNTRVFVEIDWQNGLPISTSTRQGKGYITN